jgi:hypothetical protein
VEHLWVATPVWMMFQNESAELSARIDANRIVALRTHGLGL